MERDAPPTSLAALLRAEIGAQPSGMNFGLPPRNGQPEVPRMAETGSGLPADGLVYGLGAHRLVVDGYPADQMDESQLGNQEPGAQTSRTKGRRSHFDLRPDQHQPETDGPGAQMFFTEEESWAPQQPLQQPSGSAGPEVPQPPHPDQVDQGWGNDWEDWRNGVDYGLGQLFPQVTYLTEEV